MPRVEHPGIVSVILRGEERSPVKRLPGFQSHHTLPKRADDYHNAWIASIALPALENDLNSVTRRLRDAAGYTRRRMTGAVDDNSATLTTAEFVYTVSVQLDADKPAVAVWTREIGSLKSVTPFKNGKLDPVFEGVVRELDLRFGRHADIEALIDRLEARELDVEYPFDAAWCEVPLPNDARVRIEPSGFVLAFDAATGPAHLIAAYEAFAERPLRITSER